MPLNHSSTPTPQLLRAALELTNNLPLDGWPDKKVPEGLQAISVALRKLPLEFLPESLAWAARILENATPGKIEGEGEDTSGTASWGVAVSVRIGLRQALALVSAPRRPLITLRAEDRAAMRDVARLPPKLWNLCTVHRGECQAILDATSARRLSADEQRELLQQGTVGGVVSERGGKVASFLVQELRFPEFGDHLLHGVHAHPDAPGAEDDVLRDFMIHRTGSRRVRAVLRMHQNKTRGLLSRFGFVHAGIIQQHFVGDGGAYEDADCMERPAQTKQIVQLRL